jgi:hypothetical protein
LLLLDKRAVWQKDKIILKPAALGADKKTTHGKLSALGAENF